ncbi:MAG TPA: protein kinase [Pirellulales bacterium]
MVSHNSGLPDDDRLDQAIAEFLRAESTGTAGNRQQWLDRYPECASALNEYFDDRDRLDGMMMPVRLEWSSSISRLSVNGSDGQEPVANTETIHFAPSTALLTGARYRPIRFHARGGMGEIWLAEDRRIGRQVAVKKLRAGRKDREARFLVEAQVTGQLEHPSVVPLHDVGIDEKGDPYYVMKFIQGRQLSDAIHEFHAGKKSPDWTNNLQFRRLLETFIATCNAIAYAHSKGVLHRDIKPDNVMLGSYGETLMVDWGLAKVAGRPDEPATSAVRLSGGASTATQDGTIVGSPLYMSPEGAEGRTEEIDEQSDVYLLGATLYEILTAKPPRQGSSQSELINLARKCRPQEPRKLDRRIPKTLEAICLKAMAFRKADRYATPMALADDIQRYLAGEPTTAYRESMLAKIRRWTWRHRRGILRFAAALVVAALAGWAVHSYQQSQNLARREQARASLERFHQLADESQFFAANADELSQQTPYYDFSRAIASGKEALEIARVWGPQAAELPLIDERSEFLQTRNSLLVRLVQIQLRQRGNHSRPQEILELLDQTTSDQASSREFHLLRAECLELLGDSRAAQAETKLAHEPSTVQSPDDHFLKAEMLRAKDVGSAAGSLAAGAALRRDYLNQAVAEYRAALDADPRHYWARFQLGRCLLALGRRDEALEALSACVALRPKTPWAYSARGLAQALNGSSQLALADLNRALELDPSCLPARLNRGFVFWLAHDADHALADLEAVVAAPAEHRLMEAEFYRGQIFLAQHHDREANASFEKVAAALPEFRSTYWLQAQSQFHLGEFENAQAAVERFARLDPAEEKNESLAHRYFAVGKTLRMLALELDGGAQQEAIHRAVNQLQLAIDAGDTTSEVWQHLGACYELLGNANRAIEAYTKALGLAADRTTVLNQRGWAYANAGQLDLAKADFEAALRSQASNAESHTGLGYVLAAGGADVVARREASSALLLEADNYLVLHNVACIYGRLSTSGTALDESENLAIAILRQAVALSKQAAGGPDELALIRAETTAFPDSLRHRPEFQSLLGTAVRSD